MTRLRSSYRPRSPTKKGRKPRSRPRNSKSHCVRRFRATGLEADERLSEPLHSDLEREVANEIISDLELLQKIVFQPPFKPPSNFQPSRVAWFTTEQTFEDVVPALFNVPQIPGNPEFLQEIPNNNTLIGFCIIEMILKASQEKDKITLKQFQYHIHGFQVISQSLLAMEAVIMAPRRRNVHDTPDKNLARIGKLHVECQVAIHPFQISNCTATFTFEHTKINYELNNVQQEMVNSLLRVNRYFISFNVFTDDVVNALASTQKVLNKYTPYVFSHTGSLPLSLALFYEAVKRVIVQPIQSF